MMTSAALCSDLFFASRIAEVARTLGVAHQGARELAALLAQARQAPPSVIFVDMRWRGGDPAEAIRTLRADPATSGARIVAFLPHVQEELASAAEAAGAQLVLTHGQLGKQLPALLSS
jgi:CheY-like chemotaxis protein